MAKKPRIDRLRAELAAIDEEVDRAPAASRRFQRYLPIGVAVVAIVSFSGISWYAYNQGILEGSEVAAPLIRPKGPLKIAPPSPGGEDVPNRDKFVYNQLENRDGDDRKVERLLPPPEQPKEPPHPAPVAPAAKAATAPAGGGTKTPEATTSLAPAGRPATANEAFKRAAELAGKNVPPPLPPPGSMPAPAAPAAGETGKQVAQTTESEGPIRLTPKSGAQKASPPPPPPPPATATPRLKPPAPPPVVRKEAPARMVAPPKPAAPKPAPKAVSRPAAASGAKGAFIQLGALRTEADAERAWKTAQDKNGPLLDGLRLDIERADIAGKGTYYRVQAGPLKDTAAAKALCEALQKRKQGCFVVHRK